MPAKLNGAEYNNFLRNDLPELLEDVPLNLRQQIIFQQDGAPPHNARLVRLTLTEKFPERYVLTYFCSQLNYVYYLNYALLLLINIVCAITDGLVGMVP